MKMELTAKDKKLLIFLSLFVIVVCIGYWGILPVVKDTSKIKKDIEAEEELKKENQNKINELSFIEADNETKEQEILDSRKQFFPMMDTDEVDDYITNIALSHGVFAYNLSVSTEAKEADLDPYQFSEKANLSDEESSSSEDGEGDDVSTGIYVYDVSVRYDGDKEELVKIIDELSSVGYKLRVCSYSWDEEQSIVYGDTYEDFEIITNSILNLELEIYMCEE